MGSGDFIELKPVRNLEPAPSCDEGFVDRTCALRFVRREKVFHKPWGSEAIINLMSQRPNTRRMIALDTRVVQRSDVRSPEREGELWVVFADRPLEPRESLVSIPEGRVAGQSCPGPSHGCGGLAEAAAERRVQRRRHTANVLIRRYSPSAPQMRS